MGLFGTGQPSNSAPMSADGGESSSENTATITVPASTSESLTTPLASRLFSDLLESRVNTHITKRTAGGVSMQFSPAASPPDSFAAPGDRQAQSSAFTSIPEPWWKRREPSFHNRPSVRTRRSSNNASNLSVTEQKFHRAIYGRKRLEPADRMLSRSRTGGGGGEYQESRAAFRSQNLVRPTTATAATPHRHQSSLKRSCASKNYRHVQQKDSDSVFLEEDPEEEGCSSCDEQRRCRETRSCGRSRSRSVSHQNSHCCRQGNSSPARSHLVGAARHCRRADRQASTTEDMRAGDKQNRCSARRATSVGAPRPLFSPIKYTAVSCASSDRFYGKRGEGRSGCIACSSNSSPSCLCSSNNGLSWSRCCSSTACCPATHCGNISFSSTPTSSHCSESCSLPHPYPMMQRSPADVDIEYRACGRPSSSRHHGPSGASAFDREARRDTARGLSSGGTTSYIGRSHYHSATQSLTSRAQIEGRRTFASSQAGSSTSALLLQAIAASLSNQLKTPVDVQLRPSSLTPSYPRTASPQPHPYRNSHTTGSLRTTNDLVGSSTLQEADGEPNRPSLVVSFRLPNS